VVVISELFREVFIFVGERVVYGLDALRKDKKFFGQGTTASDEIRKRQGNSRARARGKL
jgi:hypothetical protein